MRMSVQSYFSGPQDFYMEKVSCFSWSLILKLVRGSLTDSENRSGVTEINRNNGSSISEAALTCEVLEPWLKYLRSHGSSHHGSSTSEAMAQVPQVPHGRTAMAEGEPPMAIEIELALMKMLVKGTSLMHDACVCIKLYSQCLGWAWNRCNPRYFTMLS